MRAIRTYVEMREPGALKPARVESASVRIEEVRHCPSSFWRYLYTEVGREYRWVDRLPWTDEQIREYLDDPAVSLWLMSVEGAPAGYFELRKATAGDVEIVYFGLLPEFTGRGLGRHLLTEAVAAAWASGATRVWLHTCSLDHPAALPNYVARGFQVFREEEYEVI
jgi:ribosomal protein S18 acetylase RimI-like enzyme